MVLYRQGEYAAFEELYERHSGKVYAYLRGHLPQRGEADDLLQLVFLRLHEHRDRYNPSMPFLPWIFSITRHAVIDWVRKKKATPVEADEIERMAGAGPVETAPEVDLSAALASLPAESRDLIRMRFEQGLSFKEIAAELRLNEASARKRLSRTIQSVRDLLGKKHE